jgi:hypothetical protein
MIDPLERDDVDGHECRSRPPAEKQWARQMVIPPAATMAGPIHGWSRKPTTETMRNRPVATNMG